ncbi:MAG: Mth938-like domain-containing protein [Hyphomicrobium sp.]|uniref:Mth938-like domain-containing protein n=1 Tax=Hyphomicrobium sp. TaxID=82 RepID=UPI0039E23975
MTPGVARYPYETPITAYGSGGFRFADMSHRGSVLCLPSGIWAWAAKSIETIGENEIEFLLNLVEPPITVLFGTGEKQIWPSPEIYAAFAKAGIGIEPMSTGAAARTYNILIAEKRPIAAALIAVA